MVECKLLRFNPRRAARGVGAAEVELDGQILWMTRNDLNLNVRDWGPLQGLLDALAAYKAGVDFPSSATPCSAATATTRADAYRADQERRKRGRLATSDDHSECQANGCEACEFTGINPDSEAWRLYQADDADGMAAHLAARR